MPKHWDMESLGTISSDQCGWVTWHKRDELAGVLQEEVSVCWVFSCCFILTVTKLKLTACSSLLPSPHQLCVWSALCFSSFVTLSRTTWNHTLCLLGELPPLQLSACYLWHTNTHPFPPFSMATDKFVPCSSLSHRHAHFVSFSPFSKLWTRLLVLSSTCTLLSFLPLWAATMLDFSRLWMQGGIDATVLSVSVCTSGGYFTFPFILYQTESWWSEATLVFHERDRAFSKLPPRLTDREIRVRGRKWGKG